MKIHHIGYAVCDIKNARENFELLNYKVISELIFDKDRNIYIQFLKHIDSELIVELIEPLEYEYSPVSNILKKLGDTPYHICYEVRQINNEIERLINNNFILIDAPKQAMAIDNNKVAFLYKKGIGIIELLEIV